MELPKGIYLVADAGLVPDTEHLLSIISQAIEGGATTVQIRAKQFTLDELTSLCNRTLAITRPAGVPLIVNDSVEAALASGAEGLHIGQGDRSYAEARALLGPDAIIGLSLEAVEQVTQSRQSGLNYVAASPVCATPTKKDTAPALGLDGLQYIAANSPIPVVAIGGITLTNIQAIRQHGAHAAAIVSAICLAADPKEATGALKKAFAN
jgi:thiamine-phosphate pyrophosphorylase